MVFPLGPAAEMADWYQAPIRQGVLDHSPCRRPVFGELSDGFRQWQQGIGGQARLAAVPNPEREGWTTAVVMFELEEDMVLYHLTYPTPLVHPPMWTTMTIDISTFDRMGEEDAAS